MDTEKDTHPEAYAPSDSSTASLEGKEAGENVNQLARTFTNLSRKGTNNSLGPIQSNINPFFEATDPRLDPYSDKFSAREWTRHLVKLRKKADDGYLHRTAGVSFRNLSAYGYSTGSDYQKNVLNTFVSSISSLVNFRNKGTKIQILRDFNGVLKQGETCVVLGRPGR